RVRGPERSVPAPQVLAQVKTRAAEGYQEVVLTGTLLGAYRWEGIDLTAMLERLLAETPIARFRLSSLLPQDLTPALLRLWDTGRLCRHLHLPLQSGSPGVLEKMRRPYSPAQYEEAVAQARQVLAKGQGPDPALTTDVMVGFPGESDEEFEESYRFCQRMDFARVHVFSYSRRPGTPAAKMPQVGASTMHERAKRMLALAGQSVPRFHRRFVGQTLPVLWEEKKDGVWEGLTDNYLRVFTSSSEELHGRITPARLAAPYGEGLWGETASHVP
ncbi:MAG: radical SAM protein, partial [Chloroflexota bacterium]|nr:radical SAM protein [Chloroflexota bacterium]